MTEPRQDHMMEGDGGKVVVVQVLKTAYQDVTNGIQVETREPEPAP